MKAPKFTKKDFEFLADALAAARKDCAMREMGLPTDAVDTVVDRMAERLRETNPAFNPERFRDACDYGQMVLPAETSA